MGCGLTFGYRDPLALFLGSLFRNFDRSFRNDSFREPFGGFVGFDDKFKGNSQVNEVLRVFKGYPKLGFPLVASHP